MTSSWPAECKLQDVNITLRTKCFDSMFIMKVMLEVKVLRSHYMCLAGFDMCYTQAFFLRILLLWQILSRGSEFCGVNVIATVSGTGILRS